jgi:hypothetical protein
MNKVQLVIKEKIIHLIKKDNMKKRILITVKDKDKDKKIIKIIEIEKLTKKPNLKTIVNKAMIQFN